MREASEVKLTPEDRAALEEELVEVYAERERLARRAAMPNAARTVLRCEDESLGLRAAEILATLKQDDRARPSDVRVLEEQVRALAEQLASQRAGEVARLRMLADRLDACAEAARASGARCDGMPRAWQDGAWSANAGAAVLLRQAANDVEA